MGKEQDLLQAVKSGDLTSTQKLLSRLKSSRNNSENLVDVDLFCGCGPGLWSWSVDVDLVCALNLWRKRCQQDDSQTSLDQTNDMTATQLACDHKCDLHKQIKSHRDQVTQKPTAEEDACRQTPEQVEKESKLIIQEELDRVRASCQEDKQRYEAEVLTVTQRADDLQLHLDTKIKSLADNKEILQEELERIRALYQEDKQRYEADFMGVTQLVKDLQRQLDTEIKSCTERESQDKILLQDLRAEQGALSQKMFEEGKNKEILKEELDRIRASCQEDKQSYEAEVLTVRQRSDDLQLQLDTEIKSCTDRESHHQLLLQKLRAEVLEERKNKEILQEELDRVRASYQEDKQRYEADFLTVTQLVRDLQRQLDTEIKSCTERESQDKILLQDLRAEQGALSQKMFEEGKNKEILQEVLDRIRASCQEDKQKYEAEVLTVTQRSDDLQLQLDTEIKSHTNRESQHQLLLQKLRSEQDAELQEERKNKAILQEELDRASYQEDKQRYEAEVLTVARRLDDFLRQLITEIKSITDTASQDKILLQNMKAEQEALSQKMVEERKNKEVLQEELERIRASCQEDKQRYETEVLTVTKLVEDLQFQLDTEIKSGRDRESQDKILLQDLRAEQDAQLLEERKNKEILQEELDRVRASYQEDKQRYEAEVLIVAQRLDNLLHQLDTKINFCTERESHHQVLLQKLMAELLEERKNKEILQEELDRVRASYQDDKQRYEAEVLTVTQRADDLQFQLNTKIKSLAHNKEILQEELDRVRALYQEDKQNYEAEVFTVTQQSDDLQLDTEIQSLTDTASQDQLLLQKMKAEQEALSQKMVDERKKKKILQEELERIRASYQEDKQRYEADFLTVRQLVKDLQRQLDNKIKSCTERESQDKILLQDLSTEQDAELQEEMKNKEIVQEEMERIKASYQEEKQRYEADFLTVSQLADDLQLQLDTKIKSITDTASQDKILLQNMKAEQEALSQKMVDELQVERKNKEILQEELDRVKASCQEDKQRYDAEVLTVTQLIKDLQHQLDTEIKSRSDRESQDKILLQELRAEQDAELQEERKNKEILQEELETIQASYADFLTVTQRADDLQLQLDTKIKSLADTASQDQFLLQKMKAEQEVLNQKMVDELQVERKNKEILQEELERVSASCQEDRQRYDAEVLTVMLLIKDIQLQLETEIKSRSDRESQDKILLQELRAEQDAELQEERKNKEILQEELDRVRASYQDDKQI
ncbi:hypothetical protein F2P81_015475 [Scophthalmus maximus]|uniref:Uncharacterized protein n=1 Tax=Scophthalmus maximus TaxID=52904 RepID=A0A6A4SKW8_SCOMX|nr:hypothetical protein F2P81_015475 [Scophthalmus maximus]